METVELTKLTKIDLLAKCAELNIIKCASKKKHQLIELIQASNVIKNLVKPSTTNSLVENKIIEKEPEVVFNTLPNNRLKFIDLFCGIGGFHQALHRLNGQCVFASDIDTNCRNVYEKNYGIKPEGDITKLDFTKIPEFDILCGGFPCQSFSNSGNKKGLDDKRGKLFEYILQIVTLHRPQFMFLENVKHIQNIDGGKIFKHIIKRINETGYHVDTFELSPHQFGVPQQRERIVFVCIRMDIYDETKLLNIVPPKTPIHFETILEKDPEKTEKYRISKETEDILTVWDQMIQKFKVDENLSPTILCNEFNSTYSEIEFAALPKWKQDYITKNRPLYIKYKTSWDGWLQTNSEILNKKEVYSKLEWQTGKKKENDSIFNHFIQFRQSGIRVKKAQYFPTLVAIVQTPIYAKEKRYITPRECARLQSFPDSFIMHENDHTAYKQFGNAVNVDVVHFVITNTLRSYNRIDIDNR